MLAGPCASRSASTCVRGRASGRADDDMRSTSPTGTTAASRARSLSEAALRHERGQPAGNSSTAYRCPCLPDRRRHPRWPQPRLRPVRAVHRCLRRRDGKTAGGAVDRYDTNLDVKRRRRPAATRRRPAQARGALPASSRRRRDHDLLAGHPAHRTVTSSTIATRCSCAFPTASPRRLLDPHPRQSLESRASPDNDRPRQHRPKVIGDGTTGRTVIVVGPDQTYELRALVSHASAAARMPRSR